MFWVKEKVQVRSAAFEVFRNERRPDKIKIAENRGKTRKNALKFSPFLRFLFFFFFFIFFFFFLLSQNFVRMFRAIDEK